MFKSKVNKHYQDFQYTLNMLKTSVEELWQFEVDQLHRHQNTSSNSSNTKINTDVPSIYNCRPVLPIDNEIVEVKKPIQSVSNSVIVMHYPSSETVNTINDIKPKSLISQSSSQPISSKDKSTKSLISIGKKRRQHDRGDNTARCSTKKALLHLRFRCSKHTQ